MDSAPKISPSNFSDFEEGKNFGIISNQTRPQEIKNITNTNITNTNLTNQSKAQNKTEIEFQKIKVFNDYLLQDQSLDFEKGKIRLLGNELNKAKFAIRGIDNKFYLEISLAEDQLQQFNLSGKKYLIYLQRLDIGNTTNFTGANLFVINYEDDELTEEEFQKLKEKIVPKPKVYEGNEDYFAAKIESKSLIPGSLIKITENTSVIFIDIAQNNSIIVKISSTESPTLFVRIPKKHAYLYSLYGKAKYFIYFAEGGIGLEKPKIVLEVFSASRLATQQSILKINNYPKKPARLVSTEILEFNNSKTIVRDDLFRFIKAKLTDFSKEFAEIEISTNNKTFSSLLSFSHPLYFEDYFNQTYSIWINNIDYISKRANISIYKE